MKPTVNHEAELGKALTRYVRAMLPHTVPELEISWLIHDLALIVNNHLFGTDLSIYAKEEE